MKKISLVLVLMVVLLLSGCSKVEPFPQDIYYTQEEVDNLIQELEDDYMWLNDVKTIKISVLEKHVTELTNELVGLNMVINYRMDELLIWLENYLEETYYTKDELDEGFEDVRLYLEDLSSKIMVGEFVGVNAYDGETHVVVEVDGVEYEVVTDYNYLYTMNEPMIIFEVNDVYYGLPLESNAK